MALMSTKGLSHMILNTDENAKFGQRTSLMVIVFILISLSIPAYIGNPGADTEDLALQMHRADIEYVETGPIEVEGNDGFSTEHWKGDGTKEDPYELRENYSIDASSHEYGIKITNSDQHVVIENTEIYGASGDIGAGIHLEYTDNVEVTNNDLYDNDIGLYDLSNAWGDPNFVEDNDITDNRYGIYLEEKENSFYKYNYIAGNTESGIFAESSTYDNEIVENIIINNLGSGIELYDYANNNLIENNTLTGNDGSGIQCYYHSGNNQITENEIKNNLYGIKIENSTYNEIWKNEIITNTFQTSVSGDLTENNWNLEDPAERGHGGNYWSDGEQEDRGDNIGDEPYNIGEDNQDDFPWMSPEMERHPVDRFELSVDNITAGDPPEINISEAYNDEDYPLEGEYAFKVEIGTDANTSYLDFDSGDAGYVGDALEKAGEYTTEVTAEGSVESETFHVEAAETKNVTISPDEGKIITAGESLEFSAEAFDEYGNFVSDNEEDFSWENASAGIFNETNAGVYEVKAVFEGEESIESDSKNITVKPAEVDMIELKTPPEINITAGETIEFTAEAYDEYDNLITNNSDDFNWENASSGTFDKTTTGEYEIIAEYRENETFTSGPVQIGVKPGDVDSVEIESLQKTNITAGESLEFTAEAYDQFGNFVTEKPEDFIWEHASNGTFDETTAGKYQVRAIYHHNDVKSEASTVIVQPSELKEYELVVENITAGQTPDIEISSMIDEYGNLIEGEYQVEVKVNGDTKTENLTFSEGMSNLEWDEITLSKEYSVEVSIYGIDRSEEFWVEPGSPYSIEIESSEEEVISGKSVIYTSTIYDEWDNEIGEVTNETGWSVNADAKGNWENNEYKSEVPGTWNITGTFTYDGTELTDNVTLTVKPEIQVFEYTGFDTIIFEENLDYELEWSVDKNHTISSYELLAGNSSEELETIEYGLKNESYRYRFEEEGTVHFRIIGLKETGEELERTDFTVTVDLISLEVEERDKRIFSIDIPEERREEVNVTWYVDEEVEDEGQVFIPDLGSGDYNITAEVSDGEHQTERKFELSIDGSETEGRSTIIYIIIILISAIALVGAPSILKMRSKKETDNEDGLYFSQEDESKNKYRNKKSGGKKDKPSTTSSQNKKSKAKLGIKTNSNKQTDSMTEGKNGIDKQLVMQTFEDIGRATKKQAYAEVTGKTDENIGLEEFEEKIQRLVQEERLTMQPKKDAATLYIWNSERSKLN